MHPESVDEAIACFEILCARAEGQAGFDLTVPGKAFYLLHGLRVPASLWPQIFVLTGGSLPTTDDQLSAMKTMLRQYAHLLESGPRNIANLMAGPPHLHQGATHFVGMSAPEDYAEWGQPMADPTANGAYAAESKTSYAPPPTSTPASMGDAAWWTTA